MRKTLGELKKLNTKRLLHYYKTERKRFYSKGYWCDCGCGEFIWETRSNIQSCVNMESEYKEDVEYLELIKSELNIREHIFK